MCYNVHSYNYDTNESGLKFKTYMSVLGTKRLNIVRPLARVGGRGFTQLMESAG